MRLILQNSGAVSITKKSAVLTGPVITLLDLVVHVPVNCGSVCADTKGIKTALTASDDRKDKIMRYGRLVSKQVSRVDVETGKKVIDVNFSVHT